MGVKKGNKVKVEYEGSLEDGKVFDSSEHEGHSHPLEFEAGSGQVVKGFDDAVIGMELNEEKEFTLDPEEAYGERNPDAIRDFPRDSVPKEQEVKEGSVLMVTTPEGKQFPAKVAGADDKIIKVDFNHPLAGKKLHFKIKVVEVN